MKKVTIKLLSGEEFDTDKGKINYQEWGIDAVVEDDGKSRKLYIPYENIKYIEEIIS